VIATINRTGDVLTESSAACWRRHLDAAMAELLEGDGDERERLANAAASFRAALTAYRGWPAATRTEADALRAMLVAEGRFEATVAMMSDERLRETSDGLWRFCQAALAEEEPPSRGGPDLDGIEKLREAKALVAGDGLDRARLRAAAHLFWSAEFHCDSWPAELRSGAEALTAKIFRHGPIDQAVVGMSHEAAAEVKGLLLRLCDEAERLARVS